MTQTTTPALPAGAIPLPADTTRPGPNWVVLRDPESLDFGDVLDILGDTTGGQGFGKAAASMRTAILERLVTNWSFEDLPLPATEAVLRRLPGRIGLALFTAIKPAYDMINGTGSKPVMNEQTLEDEASPTGGSSA